MPLKLRLNILRCLMAEELIIYHYGRQGPLQCHFPGCGVWLASQPSTACSDAAHSSTFLVEASLSDLAPQIDCTSSRLSAHFAAQIQWASFSIAPDHLCLLCLSCCPILHHVHWTWNEKRASCTTRIVKRTANLSGKACWLLVEARPVHSQLP